MSRSVKARKLAFHAGRQCARDALAAAGSSETTVYCSETGAPECREGFICSISHNESEAVALAAKQSDWDVVGIDIETIINPNEVQRLWSLILTEQERAGAWRLKLDMSAREYLTLGFSAKEAIYKSLFAREQPMFDFCNAELVCFNHNSLCYKVSPVGVEPFMQQVSYAMNSETVLCWTAAKRR